MLQYNDIAILTLDSPVTYSQTIRSVCLPQGTQARFEGVTATVIGWGSLRESKFFIARQLFLLANSKLTKKF